MQMPKRKNSACIAYANAKPLRNMFAGTLQAPNC
jgi:hypothetical protein